MPDKVSRLEILDRFGGILPYREVFYTQFINEACDRYLRVFLEFYALAIDRREQESLFALVDAIRLSGVVSRYFYPARVGSKLHALRSRALIAGFARPNDDPLADRSARNALEHFDERLDEYLFEEPMGPQLPMFLYEGAFTEKDYEIGHIFLAANPATKQIIIFNKHYDFGSIHEAILEIRKACEIVHLNGGRFPHSNWSEVPDES